MLEAVQGVQSSPEPHFWLTSESSLANISGIVGPILDL